MVGLCVPFPARGGCFGVGRRETFQTQTQTCKICLRYRRERALSSLPDRAELRREAQVLCRRFDYDGHCGLRVLHLPSQPTRQRTTTASALSGTT